MVIKDPKLPPSCDYAISLALWSPEKQKSRQKVYLLLNHLGLEVTHTNSDHIPLLTFSHIATYCKENRKLQSSCVPRKRKNQSFSSTIAISVLIPNHRSRELKTNNNKPPQTLQSSKHIILQVKILRTDEIQQLTKSKQYS